MSDDDVFDFEGQDDEASYEMYFEGASSIGRRTSDVVVTNGEDLELTPADATFEFDYDSNARLPADFTAAMTFELNPQPTFIDISLVNAMPQDVTLYLAPVKGVRRRVTGGVAFDAWWAA